MTLTRLSCLAAVNVFWCKFRRLRARELRLAITPARLPRTSLSYFGANYVQDDGHHGLNHSCPAVRAVPWPGQSPKVLISCLPHE